jgi:hypothetical protein
MSGVMRKRVVGISAVTAALAALWFAGAGAARPRSGEPAWVIRAATLMPLSFVGHPKPISVRYAYGPKGTVLITERFGHVVVCGLCSAPMGAAQPRGRRVSERLDLRTHGVLSFGLYAN